LWPLFLPQNKKSKTPNKQNNEFSKPNEKSRKKTLTTNSVIIGPTSNVPITSSQIKRKEDLTEEQLANMYKEVVELSSGNKITVKNTWSLRLIDYIDDVLSDNLTNKVEQKTNFQKATATLDASVKIYSSRVDSVHTDTYKMLGGLSRTKEVKDRNQNEEGNEDAPKDNEELQPEKKEKKRIRNQYVGNKFK